MRRPTLLLVTTLAVGLVGVLPAHAKVWCAQTDSDGVCTLEASADPVPAGQPGTSGTGKKVMVGTLECASVRPIQDPFEYMWGEHRDKNGKTEGYLYWCENPARPGRVGDKWFWSPEKLQGDPEVLARRAVEQMGLQAPEIGLTGYGRPESMQLLGLPTWMWAADPGDSTTGPITKTVDEGGVTVTATGRLTETIWQMGDGSVVTCAGDNAAGTPYDQSYGGDPSPTCGYRYGWTSAREPGRAFTVVVTANWAITWEGGDDSGVITMSFVRSTQLRVGEVQILTTEGGQGKKK